MVANIAIGDAHNIESSGADNLSRRRGHNDGERDIFSIDATIVLQWSEAGVARPESAYVLSKILCDFKAEPNALDFFPCIYHKDHLLLIFKGLFYKTFFSRPCEHESHS